VTEDASKGDISSPRAHTSQTQDRHAKVIQIYICKNQEDILLHTQTHPYSLTHWLHERTPSRRCAAWLAVSGASGSAIRVKVSFSCKRVAIRYEPASAALTALVCAQAAAPLAAKAAGGVARSWASTASRLRTPRSALALGERALGERALRRTWEQCRQEQHNHYARGFQGIEGALVTHGCQ
jgi:hypothetical protein